MLISIVVLALLAAEYLVGFQIQDSLQGVLYPALAISVAANCFLEIIESKKASESPSENG
jgi:hypothetical protein